MAWVALLPAAAATLALGPGSRPGQLRLFLFAQQTRGTAPSALSMTQLRRVLLSIAIAIHIISLFIHCPRLSCYRLIFLGRDVHYRICYAAKGLRNAEALLRSAILLPHSQPPRRLRFSSLG